MKKVFWMILLMGTISLAQAQDKKSVFMAGAAKAVMTPDMSNAAVPVWLAGYQGGRAAAGVHDDLWITALALQDARGTALFITLDLIGYLFDEVSQTKALLEKELKVPSSRIFIFSTHNHSGPDTIGLWGKDGKTGKDPNYLNALRGKIKACAQEAMENFSPARAAFGGIRYDNPIEDSRPPKVMNDLLLSMRLEDLEGKTIATLVNYALHAEVLNGKNTRITSDYPGVLRKQLEKEYGGVGIFVPADIGGMQSPFVLFHSFWARDRVGKSIAKKVIESLSGSKAIEIPSFNIRTQDILFPVENKKYIGAIESGLFGRSQEFLKKVDGKYYLPADIGLIEIGPAKFLTLPGEAFPELGNVYRFKMTGDYRFVLGLANNEIGYLVPDDEWQNDGYEENMSLGPQTAAILTKAVTELLRR